MTRLLVSVRDAEEARQVSRYPIGILDVKEPELGALGAADAATLNDVSNVCCEELEKSFSAGELSDWTQKISESDRCPLESKYGAMLQQFRFVKLGLAGMSRQPEWRSHWRSLFSTLPGQSSAVAVAYFDHPTCGAPSLSEVIELAKEQPNCSTVLFDTFEKLGDLFSHISKNKLADLICESRRHGLTTVVAGSVNQGSLADVLESAPDYIGVRGAVCRGGREGRIDGRLISELLTAMQAPVKI